MTNNTQKHMHNNTHILNTKMTIGLLQYHIIVGLEALQYPKMLLPPLALGQLGHSNDKGFL